MATTLDSKDRKIPENIFRVIELSSADDLLKLRGLSSSYLFRGQNRASWKLETSLERQVKGKGSSPGQEKDMLQEFQRRAHNYTNSIPEYNNTIEWLALMQHYGCPTSLLDFTRSMFIGAYFAVDDYVSDSDAVLWGVNQMTLSHIYKDSPGLHFLASDNGRSNQNNINSYLTGSSKTDGVISITPFKMNERLMIQQGAFMLPLNINKTFEHNLFSTFGVEPEVQKNAPIIKFSETDYQEIVRIMMLGSIIKLIIPKGVKKSILLLLRQFNIEPQYLFPGLEGLAKSQTCLLDVVSSSFKYSQ